MGRLARYPRLMGAFARFALAGEMAFRGNFLMRILVEVLFCCGPALAYSFLLLLTSSSVWLMRNQSLMEMWWLVTTLMRYPREIYKGKWGEPIGRVFWFVIPLMLVTNVPARVAVREGF